MNHMKRIGISATVMGAALALAFGQPAAGQGAGSALQGHDTNAPVDVAADRLEVQDRADRAILSGNVKVRQGSLELDTARLTVAYSQAGGVEIQRLDASGGVTMRSPSETARADFAVYDLENRIITMLGDVSLLRGQSRVQGGRLTIDLESGRAVRDGGGPPGTTNQGGRVTGTLTVPQRRG